MIPIDSNSVVLDPDVANDIANFLAEEKASTIDMEIDEKWTLNITVEYFTGRKQTVIISNELWEAIHSA